MSKRNSLASKSAARERLRAEREQQVKKEKIRRQLVVGGAVAAVLALGTGIAFAVIQATRPGEWEAAADKPLVKPANTEGKDGTTVIVGDKDAEHTLEVYEDMRCPICAAFEQQAGEAVLKGAEDGKYKVSYTMASFLDRESQSGSKNALSALGAALDVSTDAFVEYHTLLYSAEHHPQETDDAFADDAHLIELAQKVDALKDNKAFEDAVTNGTYDKWALVMSEKFDKSGVQGTPTVKLDGATVENVQAMTGEQFTEAVDEKLGAE